MGVPLDLGKKVIVKVIHHGCWATELSAYFHKERPDLQLVVYSKSARDEPLMYNAVAIIKSTKKKEITEAEREAIKVYLLQHNIIRSLKPRIKSPSKYTLIIFTSVFDAETPAAIRAVMTHGGIICPDIGMPVMNGVEHVTFFSKNPALVAAEIQEEYAKAPSTYEVVGVEISEENYDSYEKLRNDPYYLPSYIICKEDLRGAFLESLKKGTDILREWILKNAPWLFPLLAQIYRWLSFNPPPHTSNIPQFLI